MNRNQNQNVFEQIKQDIRRKEGLNVKDNTLNISNIEINVTSDTNPDDYKDTIDSILKQNIENIEDGNFSILTGSNIHTTEGKPVNGDILLHINSDFFHTHMSQLTNP